VAIIHGAGRSFCTGADIKQWFVAMTPEQSARRERDPNPEGYMGRTINWKPAIAAESDMILASEDATFGITETRRGLPGGWIWAKVNAFMPYKSP
jgi:enoyl-CoA hydratase/carnithine racemase